jgi:hypothetical protein
MSLREIRDVNVISDAAAIGGRIVDTEYFKMRPSATNNFASDFKHRPLARVVMTGIDDGGLEEGPASEAPKDAREALY